VADLLINAEIFFPQDEAVQMANVLHRSIDADGNIVGTCDENLNLNTLLYDVEFPDRAVEPCAANIITKDVSMQVDSNGHNSYLLDKLVLHKRMGNIVSKENAYVTTKRGEGNFVKQQLVGSFSVNGRMVQSLGFFESVKGISPHQSS
jgi:hypothetical protein